MGPPTETSVSSSSPSGGLACAIAALAERQQIGGDSSSSYNGNVLAYSMLPGSSRFSSREEQVKISYPISGGSIEGLPDIGNEGEWVVDGSRSEVVEVGPVMMGQIMQKMSIEFQRPPEMKLTWVALKLLQGGPLFLRASRSK